MMFLSLHVTCSCTFHAYIPSFIFILILICVDAFLRVSLSLSLSISLSLSLSLSLSRLVTLWHPNENPLRPRTLFVLGHLLLLTPLLLTYNSVMIKPVRTFQRTSHDKAFIRNAKSFYRNFPILTFPLSSTVRVGSHCMASRSLVPLWLYRSFTPTGTNSILQYLSLSLAFKVHTL